LERRDLSAPEVLGGFAEHLFRGEAYVAEQPSVLGEFAQRSPLAATDDPSGEGAEAGAQCWRLYLAENGIPCRPPAKVGSWSI
jgi:hypothetical protein